MTTDSTTDRLEHARELIIRAVAVLAPVEINEDADVAETLDIATAIEARANLRDEEERITRRLAARHTAREHRNEHGDTTAPAVADETDYRDQGAVRSTTDPAAARRFTDPDEADRRARALRHGTAATGYWPLADFARHPHGTDSARGFAVSTAPGCWLAD